MLAAPYDVTHGRRASPQAARPDALGSTERYRRALPGASVRRWVLDSSAQPFHDAATGGGDVAGMRGPARGGCGDQRGQRAGRVGERPGGLLLAQVAVVGGDVAFGRDALCRCGGALDE